MDRYKEAIEAIKSNYPPENYTILREGLDLAIEVLEKQIPSRVIVKYTQDNFNIVCDGYFCPTCDKEVLYGYCEHCGQKVDWR